MTSWTKELDEAAELATRRGYWHIILFYLLCGLAGIPTSFLVFSQVFTNATPQHWCAPPPEIEVLGIPDGLVQSLLIPRTSDNSTYEECRLHDVEPRALYAALSEYVDERSEVIREGGALRLVRIRQLVAVTDEEQRKKQLDKVKEAILEVRSEEPVSCNHGWKYSSEHYERTLVTDFSLVCEKSSWPRISNTLFWVGSIFGNLFFGWMSDRYGRRPTILLMILLEVPLAVSTAFVKNYATYTALRVVGGLFFPALYQLPFILALELMPPKRRTYTGIVVGMLFAGGMCLLSLVAFALRDWFALSLATSLPFLLLYSYFWIIPESPRWLVGRGRIAEAEKVLRNLARRNGIQLQHGFLLELHKKVKDEEDAAIEASMLANGHVIIGLPELRDTDNSQYVDRRISNMLTFKPDLTRIPETDVESNKSSDIERRIALEVAEIVNRKSRLKKEKDDCNYDDNLDISTDSIKETSVSVNKQSPTRKEVDEIFDVMIENCEEDKVLNEESHLNSESRQKATQTDPYKSPVHTFRRKSIQLVNKLFINNEGSEINLEDKRLDEENSEGDCKASPLDIFRYPNIRKKFFLLTFVWVALGVVYNSSSYNTPNLGVDDYLAFFIGGAVEIPSYFLAWRSMDRFGRRWVLCIFMCIGGVACLCCVFIPESMPWVTVSLAMVGRFCAAASFAVFYVLIGELLPTVLRSQAMATSSFIAGLGLLACPYIVYLAVYSRVLPLLLMGVLSLAGGITALLLPETLNQPLPQTLGDGEMFGRDFKIFSCVKS